MLRACHVLHSGRVTTGEEKSGVRTTLERLSTCQHTFTTGMVRGVCNCFANVSHGVISNADHVGKLSHGGNGLQSTLSGLGADSEVTVPAESANSKGVPVHAGCRRRFRFHQVLELGVVV